MEHGRAGERYLLGGPNWTVSRILRAPRARVEGARAAGSSCRTRCSDARRQLLEHAYKALDKEPPVERISVEMAPGLLVVRLVEGGARARLRGARSVGDARRHHPRSADADHLNARDARVAKKKSLVLSFWRPWRSWRFYLVSSVLDASFAGSDRDRALPALRQAGAGAAQHGHRSAVRLQRRGVVPRRQRRRRMGASTRGPIRTAVPCSLHWRSDARGRFHWGHALRPRRLRSAGAARLAGARARGRRDRARAGRRRRGGDVRAGDDAARSSAPRCARRRRRGPRARAIRRRVRSERGRLRARRRLRCARTSSTSSTRRRARR